MSTFGREQDAAWARDRIRANGGAKPAPEVVQLVQPKADKRLIQSSGAFVADYVAPEYMIEGIFQRRRIYSLTGKTGDGKTALQLYFAYALAEKVRVGKREVEQCRVLYLAGENPDDVRARWLAMSDVLGFDVDVVEVYFIPGVFSVSGLLERVKIEAEAIGGFGCVIVDTSAAYFEGEEENSNVQAGRHARTLRGLIEVKGEPLVIVGCHPIKSGENLLPRGGGAYVAEVDGNATAQKITDDVVQLHWAGKYRGPNFEPVPFELVTITSDKVQDAKGRLIPTVMAKPVTDAKVEGIEEEDANNEDQVLVLLDTTPGLSQAKMAEALGWVSQFGPDKGKVNRCLSKLERHRLASKDRRGKYCLTEKGKAEVKKQCKQI
jgi:hypothetical protein